MIDLKKYFVKVSVKEKIITEGIQILPRCTKSISGFSFLPEEILENLTEYGFENTGYINILSDKINEYTPMEGVFEDSINEVKKLIDNNYGDVKLSSIQYDKVSIKVDEGTSVSILMMSIKAMRDKDCKFYLPINNGLHEFTSEDILKICDIICVEQQNLHQDMQSYYKELDEIKTLYDIKKLNYE